MPKIKAKGQTVQTGERPHTNGRTHTHTHTHGRYQMYYLPCYAVDNNQHWNIALLLLHGFLSSFGHPFIIIIIIIIAWLVVNRRCRLHQRPLCRSYAHGKHFSLDVTGSSPPGKRGQVGWPETRRTAWNRPCGAPTRPAHPFARHSFTTSTGRAQGRI